MTTDAGSTAGGTEQGATGGVAAAPGERRARRHREIMDAAAAVFSEKGFHGASTRDIAERVGLRQGSLYYHFPSKEAALEEVCRIGVQEFVDGLAAIVAGDGEPVDKLRAAVVNHLGPLRDRRAYVRTFLFSRHSLPPELRGEVARLSRAYEALLRRLIEQGRAAGAFRAAVEPALAVKAFTGMCNAAAASHRPDARTPLEDYIAAFTALILHGLTGDT